MKHEQPTPAPPLLPFDTSSRVVRVPARLRFDGRDVSGHTTSLGLQVIQMDAPSTLFGQAPDELPLFAALELALPVATLQVDVHVTAFDLDPQRPADSVSLSARYARLRPTDRQQLHDFLAEYRPLVLVMGRADAARSRLERLLRTRYDVRSASSAAEANVALDGDRASVILVAGSDDDPSAVDFIASQQQQGAVVIGLIGSAVVGDAPFLSMARVWPLLGRPLRDELVEQLVHDGVTHFDLGRENQHLRLSFGRANRRLEREVAYLSERLSGLAGFESIVGESQALKRSLDEIARIKKTDISVHIQGETGTGKELVARALHSGGPRSEGPFVAFNCAGLTESLLQAALFGHEKGAFTGATRSRTGLFQDAHTGTLFLDEVADLSASAQAALLRVLQEGEVLPVGATQPLRVDVRLLSATHKDLRQEMEAGNFRKDLYYRLAVVTTRLPTLRERTGDVPLLARHFLDRLCERYERDIIGFTTEAMTALERYPWPGNVRELQNEIARAMVLTEERRRVQLSALSEHVRGEPSPREARSDPDGAEEPAELTIVVPLSYDEAVETLQRTLVSRAMTLAGGVVSHAATRLGIQRTRLHKILDRLGLRR